MPIWSSEIKEIERLYQSVKGRFPDIEKELERLIKTDDENIVLVYSRRCLEVIITELCETELKRPRKTEPLKGIIDKLAHEEKVPSHIIASMDGLNTLSTFGAHPKDFDPEQVKPVLVNLAVIIKWYMKYKDSQSVSKSKPGGESAAIKVQTGEGKTNGKLELLEDKTIGIVKSDEDQIIIKAKTDEAAAIEKTITEGEKTGSKRDEAPRTFFRRLKMKFVLPALLILALIIFFIFSSGSTLPFSKRDWIVITDFENFTDDPVFDKSLYTAFSIATNQSRYINIFPGSRMLETLKRMEISDPGYIDDKTGREIAIREGIKIYIVPSISRTGNKFAIAAKIVETKSGDILKSEILYTDTQDEILPALDRLSRKLRLRLGESRYNIAAQDKPLKTVTTSSLEALKLYSLGIDHHMRLNFEDARDYYDRALKIDTGFIAAKASLGCIMIEQGFDPVTGKKFLDQAIRYIDNLTEKEKLGILAFHAVNVENDLAKGIKYAKMRLALYPDDAACHNNLGWYYQNAGLFQEALAEYKKTIHIDPNWALTYGGIVWVYIEYTGDADSALIWAEKMVSVHPQNVWSYYYLGSACMCSDNLSKAETAYLKAREISPDFIVNLYNLVHNYRLQGKYIEAIDILNNILDINKDEAPAYYNLGINYQILGKQEEAQKYFSVFKKIVTEEWMKKRPDDAGTYISLSAVSARLNDIETSSQMLQKAIEMDSTMHDRFAEVLCIQGKIPEAINQLEKAFKNGYRNLISLKVSPDLQILYYDVRFRNLMNEYFNPETKPDLTEN